MTNVFASNPHGSAPAYPQGTPTSSTTARSGHEQVVFCQDTQTGLRAIIAIYSTALGPSLGGTRFFPYPTEDAALAELLEPARLAPSAMNSQPWWFSAEGKAIHVWRKQIGLKKLLLGSMNLIDVGIALCHAVLAIEHAGKAFSVEVNAPANALEGHDYLLTLRLHS